MMQEETDSEKQETITNPETVGSSAASVTEEKAEISATISASEAAASSEDKENSSTGDEIKPEKQDDSVAPVTEVKTEISANKENGSTEDETKSEKQDDSKDTSCLFILSCILGGIEFFILSSFVPCKLFISRETIGLFWIYLLMLFVCLPLVGVIVGALCYVWHQVFKVPLLNIAPVMAMWGALYYWWSLDKLNSTSAHMWFLLAAVAASGLTHVMVPLDKKDMTQDDTFREFFSAVAFFPMLVISHVSVIWGISTL